MCKSKLLALSMALAIGSATMIIANAQTQPKQSKGTAQMLAQLNEPANYSATMMVYIIPTGNTPNIDVPPLRFNVARMGTDRRWAFQLPVIGQVIYLENGAHHYLILPARNQYVEIDPQKMGIRLPWAVTPSAVIDYIRQQSKFDSVGTTVINGRRAATYKAGGVADTHTQAGTIKNETVVFVGEQTGLPLRVELDNMASSGAGARVIIETENIDTTPQATLFNLPTGMNKVSSEELKQEVNGFVSAMRSFYEALLQQQASR